MAPDTDPEKFPKVSLQNLSGPILLQRWKQGDQQAAQVLADRYTLRMIAFIAGRLNRRYRDTVDPEDIVQSALGSFFHAARHSKLQVSQNVSFWNLLATFAKRKMMRNIDRLSANKRGGEFLRMEMGDDLDVIDQPIASSMTDDVFDSLYEEIHDQIGADAISDSRAIVDRLIAGQSQQEIALGLGISQRTVRRRITKIREILTADESQSVKCDGPDSQWQPALPRIDYREFVLGKYVGAGGFGKVYRARMQSDASLVAVKFMRKGFWKSDIARTSFLREIDLAAQVNHVGVIKYYGWGQSPHGGPYIVSQWIDAVTLSDRHDVPPLQFINYLGQICDALKSVHDLDLVHGDLTPSNILVSTKNIVTITDFGFSRSYKRLDKSLDKAPEAPPLGGTLGFAAPEQISAAFGEIGPPTDIYAIGGLSHWYLTGRAPHQSDTAEQAITSTLSESVVATQPTETVSATKSGDAKPFRLIQQIADIALKQSVAERPQQVDQVIEKIRC